MQYRDQGQTNGSSSTCPSLPMVLFVLGLASFSAQGDPVDKGGLFGDGDGAQFGLWRPIQGDQSGGLEGGFVPALRFVPGRPTTALAGTNAGLFRSEDGGANWQPSRVGLPRQATIAAIVFHPLDTRVFVATAQNGVFQSSDAGLTWLPSNSNTEYESFFALDIDSTGQLLIGGGNNATVYRSSDGGLNWQIIDAGLSRSSTITAFAIDPTNASTIYAGVQAFDSGDQGVYRSVDGGLTWSAASNGLVDGGPTLGVNTLVMSPSSPTKLYAGTFCSGIYRTLDGAQSWNRVDDSGCVEAIAIDPENPLRIAATGSISVDGGESWTASVASDDGAVALAFRPGSNGELLAGGNDWGVFRSSQGGTQWQPSRAGLHAGQPSHVAAVQRDDGLLLVAPVNETGVYRSTNGGRSWLRGASPIDLDFSRVVFSSTNPDRGYVGTQCKGVFTTTDGGATWSPANTGIESECVTSLAINASNPLRALAATDTFPNGAVWVTDDGGASWTKGGLTIGTGGEVLAVAADPRAGNNTVYAGVSDPNGAATQMVYRSLDGGQSWAMTDSTIKDSGGSGVTSIALGGLDAPELIYAGTLDEGIYRSMNSGDSWTRLPDSGSFIFDVIVDPSDPARVLASDGSLSTESGLNFRPIGPNFPFGFTVAFNPADPRQVFNASFFGLFERRLDEVRIPIPEPLDIFDDDRFGSAVLVRGNEILVSGPGNDGRGTVYVYAREGEDLILVQELVPPPGFVVSEFGAAMTLSGNRLVIGAPGESPEKGAQSLQAAIFERLQGGWGFSKPVTTPAEAAGGRFGEAMALDGTRLVVGAPATSDGMAFEGSAWVFELDDGPVGPPERLRPVQNMANARFGSAISANEGRVAIGAPGSVFTGAVAGSVSLYDQVAGNLDLLGVATAAGSDDNAAFGTSVALAGSMLAVGAPGDIDDTGQVFVFDFEASGVSQRAGIEPSLADVGGGFGQSLAFNGERLIVGAPNANSSGGRQGAITIFDLAGGGFVETDRFVPDQVDTAGFGSAAAFDDDTIIIGAPLSDGAAGEALLILSTERIFAIGFE